MIRPIFISTLIMGITMCMKTHEPEITGVQMGPNGTIILTGSPIEVSVVDKTGREILYTEVSRNDTVADFKQTLAESGIINPALNEFTNLLLRDSQLMDEEVLSLLKLDDGTFVSLSNRPLVLTLDTWEVVN